MELSVQGIPVRTFDAPLGGPTDVSRHAALLLGLRQAEVARLLEVQQLLPSSTGVPTLLAPPFRRCLTALVRPFRLAPKGPRLAPC